MQRVMFMVFLCIFAFTDQSLWAENIRKSSSEEQTHIDKTEISDIKTIRVLDLKTAEQIALADNPSLDAAKERVRQAKERVTQARSRYYPELNAAASGSRTWFSDTAYLPGTDDPQDRFKGGLTATWVLFDGFERKFSVESARFAELESQETHSNARRLILSSVAKAYHNAQLSRENIAIADADQAFYLKKVGDAKARRRVGTGSLSDVLTLQVQVNSAKTERIRAKQSYDTAMFGLAALMGIPDVQFPPGMELAQLRPETSEELTSPEPDPLVTYALAHRPDVLKNDYALKQAHSGVELARSGFFPTISLSGSVDGERTDNLSFGKDDFGSTVALSLSYNLFDGGLRRAKLREAKNRKKESERTLENVKITVVSEVRDAIANLVSAQEQLVLQQSNADLVRQNRDLVEKEYAAGQASLVRLNEAQRDMIAAQGRLALARVSLRQAWYDIEVSTGAQNFP